MVSTDYIELEMEDYTAEHYGICRRMYGCYLIADDANLLEIGVFEGVGQFQPKFQVTGHPPTVFARLDRPVNGVQLCC